MGKVSELNEVRLKSCMVESDGGGIDSPFDSSLVPDGEMYFAVRLQEQSSRSPLFHIIVLAQTATASSPSVPANAGFTRVPASNSLR